MNRISHEALRATPPEKGLPHCGVAALGQRRGHGLRQLHGPAMISSATDN